MGAEPEPPPLGEVVLHPGEYFVGSGHRIRTLLGSCVAITLWHPERRIGAMCHFLLWSRVAQPGQVLDGRYGNEVLPLMLQQLALLGVRGADCHGKLFGGGDMFPALTPPPTAPAGTAAPASRAALPSASASPSPSPSPSPPYTRVGQRNGTAARQLLQQHGISLVAESLFGVGHRQIVFNLRSGHVAVRHAQPQHTRPADWSNTA